MVKTYYRNEYTEKQWKVQPKRYRKGYCPTICKSQKSAEHEQERLERITGFEWTITVIPE